MPNGTLVSLTGDSSDLGCGRVRVHDGAGARRRRAATVGTVAAKDYVTFGPATSTLGAATFTIETWFKRDAAGVATSTGSGGVVAIPLVTKGMAEGEGGGLDMNYFLGIRQADNLLVADFEDTATGLNHPVAGVDLTIHAANGAWHHAAATYDGTTWRLYLDGVLDGQLVVGNSRRQFDSLQHAVLGSALNSTGGITSGQTRASSPASSTKRASGTTRAAPRRSRPR